MDHSDRVPTLLAEPWKQNVASDIVNRNDEKFEQLFTVTERQQIILAVQQERDTLRAMPFL